MRRTSCDHLYIFSFFFNDTATTEIYTLSLHDALPILSSAGISCAWASSAIGIIPTPRCRRSEEHTSELQSRLHLVCRLLLEKKNIDMLRFPQLIRNVTIIGPFHH